MARLSELTATVRKRPALRDLGWVLALVLIALWVSRPAMSGDGVTLADSQILGSICAIMVAAQWASTSWSATPGWSSRPRCLLRHRCLRQCLVDPGRRLAPAARGWPARW